MSNFPAALMVSVLAGGLHCAVLLFIVLGGPPNVLVGILAVVLSVVVTITSAVFLMRSRRRSAENIARLSRQLARLSDLGASAPRADSLILEQLPDPLVVLAPDSAILRMNASARNLYGDDMASVLRHPGLRNAIDRVRSGQGPQTAQLSLPVPVPREVRAMVVPLNAGTADVVLLLSDRSRERAVQQMRTDFIANVSHELRTPLAVLVGFIQTLQGPAADDAPARARFLGIMAEQSARMNRLIDDLLSLSRIELMEHRPPLEMIDIQLELSRVVASFEPRMREADLRLQVGIEHALPTLAADADQLTQVLNNLLDNAMKYGAAGGMIRLRAERADQSDKRLPSRAGLVITVADEGGGIAREHLSRLTERFYRVDKGRSRSVGGTGLGLAIVKHIVNRHRGHLLIDSEVGRGTTITVWLPLPRAEIDRPVG